VRAPINTYHDVTPIARVLGFFNEDIPCIDRGFLANVQTLFRVNVMMCLITAKTLFALPIMTPVCLYNLFVGKYLRDISQNLKSILNEQAANHEGTIAFVKSSFSGRSVVNIY